MQFRLKPLSQQVVVITGATSGVGLAAARKAASAGAAVVLAARNEDVLKEVCEEIVAAGGRAHAVAGDVGDPRDVAKIARAAVARFGRIDTWVNDAGVGLYAALEDTPTDEHERLFRTNYFGVVNGSLEAARQLKAQGGQGGAIINVGSALSDLTIPQMGAYAASKQAVKGFTDAFRQELRRERRSISVTLIRPGGVSSPFAEHARSHLDHAGRLPRPLYAPEVVADAILHAAQRPVRELVIGAGAGGWSLAGRAPRLSERMLRSNGPRTESGRPKAADDNLFSAGRDGHVHADASKGRRFSVYTSAQKNPGLVVGVGLGLGAVVAVGVAAYLGRGVFARSARPIAAKLARPIAIRTFQRRPWQAASVAAADPIRAAKLAAALR